MGKKQKSAAGFNTPFHDLKARLASAAPPAPPPAAEPSARGQRAAGSQAGIRRPPPVSRGLGPSEGGRESLPLDDEDAFFAEMAGVQRLDPAARERAAAPPPPAVAPTRVRDDEAEAYARLCDLVEGDGPFDIADTQEYVEGIAPGIDRRLLKRLRDGDYALQGHLDLHGLTTEVARERVLRFVQEARAEGKRCVLIVHGRGLNSKDHIPVLKERLRLWLTRGRVARSVLCFATARPYDGGAGAVYVLLRR